MSATPLGWNSPEFPPPPEMEGDDLVLLLSTGEERRGSHLRWWNGADAGWIYEATLADVHEVKIVGWKIPAAT